MFDPIIRNRKDAVQSVVSFEKKKKEEKKKKRIRLEGETGRWAYLQNSSLFSRIKDETLKYDRCNVEVI